MAQLEEPGINTTGVRSWIPHWGRPMKYITHYISILASTHVALTQAAPHASWFFCSAYCTVRYGSDGHVGGVVSLTSLLSVVNLQREMIRLSNTSLKPK